MGLEAAYQYQAEHPVSLAATAALLQAGPDDRAVTDGMVIGAFGLTDGSVVKISTEGGKHFRAECVARPASQSIWHRFRFHLRTLFGLEGGRTWRLDARRAEEVRQWLATFRPTERARQLALTRQKQTQHIERVHRASVAPRFDKARREKATWLAAVLSNILPFLDAQARLHVTSVSIATWNAGKHERVAALAMTRVADVCSSSALLAALSQAGKLRDGGVLMARQYAELLAELTTRVRLLPRHERRPAFLAVVAHVRRTEASLRVVAYADCETGTAPRRIPPYTRSAVVALVQVAADDEDLYCAGAAITDPLCHLIDALSGSTDDLATAEQRFRVYLSMMRNSSTVPAIARRAWARLIPQASAWLDAPAHLHPDLQRQAVPVLVAAATATRRKMGECDAVGNEVATRWRAMTEVALALPDTHPLKGVALQALARHLPRQESDGGPDGSGIDVPALREFRDRIDAATLRLQAGQADSVTAALPEAFSAAEPHTAREVAGGAKPAQKAA